MVSEWPVTLVGCKIYGKNIKEKVSEEFHLFQHVYHTIASLH